MESVSALIGKEAVVNLTDWVKHQVLRSEENYLQGQNAMKFIEFFIKECICDGDMSQWMIGTELATINKHHEITKITTDYGGDFCALRYTTKNLGELATNLKSAVVNRDANKFVREKLENYWDFEYSLENFSDIMKKEPYPLEPQKQPLYKLCDDLKKQMTDSFNLIKKQTENIEKGFEEILSKIPHSDNHVAETIYKEIGKIKSDYYELLREHVSDDYVVSCIENDVLKLKDEILPEILEECQTQIEVKGRGGR